MLPLPGGIGHGWTKRGHDKIVQLHKKKTHKEYPQTGIVLQRSLNPQQLGHTQGFNSTKIVTSPVL